MDDVISWLKYSLICSGLAVPFGCLAAVCSFLQTRKAHINLRILDFILCICYVLLPTFAVVNFATNQSQWIIIQIHTAFPTVIRFTGMGICIERGLATIHAKKYENDSRFRFIVPIIILFIAIMFFIEKASISWSKQNFIVIYGFNLIANIIYFLSAHKLFRVNMKKTKKIEKFNLSQRFQTVENVKMLKLFKCQAFIDVAGGLSATIIGLFIGRLTNPLIAARIFYLVYDVYVIVTACHWGFRQMPKTICQHIQFQNKIHNSGENKTTTTKVLTIKTVLGKEIQVDEAIDHYFKHLKNAWN